MPTGKKRRVFEQGHRRKMLVVADETAEVDAALYFAASRVAHAAGGQIALLYVIEPQDYQHWMGVGQVHVDEQTNKGKAVFRLLRRKLSGAGFDQVQVDEIIREGRKAEEIVKLIEEDEDIAVLVLGAAADAKGPGPLVSTLAAGKYAGSFPIPIVIVPGSLSLEDITALA